MKIETFPAYCDSDKKREQFRHIKKHRKNLNTIMDKSRQKEDFSKLLQEELKK